MIGLTYSELKALSPCENSLRRVTSLLGGKWKKPIDAATARKAGVTLNDIIWAASAVAQSNFDVERRVRLWLCDCAAHVHPIFASEHSTDDRPRLAIEAARKFVRGEIDITAIATVKDAANAARDAATNASWAATNAAWAVSDAALAVSGAACAAANATAWTARAVSDAARNAAWAADDAVRATELAWQYDRLVLWLSDPEPNDWPITVPGKAEAA